LFSVEADVDEEGDDGDGAGEADDPAGGFVPVGGGEEG